MKCILMNLLGIEVSFKKQSGEVCTELPPIVKALMGSAVLLVLLVVLSR